MLSTRMKLIIYLLSSFGLLLSPLLSFADDYSNNIGFMKNPPKELKEKFPMCDQFLDIKWIRQFSDGNSSKNWIGRVYVDLFGYAGKNKRELVVAEREPREDEIKIYMYDVTTSKYQGDNLDRLIASAEQIFAKSGLLDLGINNKDTIITDKATSKLSGLAQFNQNICIVRPRGEGSWLIQQNYPFSKDSHNFQAEYPRLQQLKNLISTECKEEANRKWPSTFYNDYCLNTSIISSMAIDDTDGDGIQDYQDRKIIAFLNDPQPFIIPYPKCRKQYSRVHAKDFYEPYEKQKIQQCVAEEKRKFLQNIKNAN